MSLSLNNKDGPIYRVIMSNCCLMIEKVTNMARISISTSLVMSGSQINVGVAFVTILLRNCKSWFWSPNKLVKALENNLEILKGSSL